jgi:calcineurin-like phosphoesterase family protein
MARTYVIGDVHGAYRALEQVIERVAPKRDDRLIFLGDYVDGWSESRQVIEYLLALKALHACIFIRGNHDAWCQEWLEGWGASPDWLYHGGDATVKSYGGIVAADLARHLDFFSQLQYFHEDGSGRLFIHAGFSSMRGPLLEQYESNYWWDRTLWETALATDDRIAPDSPFYPERLLLYNEIYIGHTPTTNYGFDTPMKRCNVWDMDTGAAFTGRITAMDVQTKKIVQSDVVRMLYPGESGRNK